MPSDQTKQNPEERCAHEREQCVDAAKEPPDESWAFEWRLQIGWRGNPERRRGEQLLAIDGGRRLAEIEARQRVTSGVLEEILPVRVGRLAIAGNLQAARRLDILLLKKLREAECGVGVTAGVRTQAAFEQPFRLAERFGIRRRRLTEQLECPVEHVRAARRTSSDEGIPETIDASV